MKYSYIAAVFASALLLNACKDSSQQEQCEEENAKMRQDMEQMRAELESMKRAEAEKSAREEQSRAEERRAHELELQTPAHARTNRETNMSIADIVAQLEKYASVGDIRYDKLTQSSYTVGEGLLKHYNLMCDGLETITDYPYVAVVMSLALENGPSSLPKERYLKTLLAAGASPNGFGNGVTALARAAEYGLEECVQILLDAGADVNERKSYHNSALGEACSGGHAGCVKLLLAAGADVNARAVYGKTPMEMAIDQGHMDCVRLLQESGRVDTSQYGKALESAAESNDYALIRQILDAGGATASSRSEALAIALRKDKDYVKPEIVKMLLKAGASPNATVIDNESVLMRACKLKNDTCVKLLLEAGANVNGTDERGDTPIVYALSSPSCVQLLLDAGADVSIKNVNGDSALRQAIYYNCSEAVKLMTGTGKLDRKFCTQVMLDILGDETLHSQRLDADCFKYLLAAGANPNAKDSEGFPALILACEWGREEVMRLLLRNGAKVNATGPGNLTALMTACCRRGYPECVKLLLKSKANIHIRSVRNMTAVDYAVENNKPDCVELLKAAGAVETSPLERH